MVTAFYWFISTDLIFNICIILSFILINVISAQSVRSFFFFLLSLVLCMHEICEKAAELLLLFYYWMLTRKSFIVCLMFDIMTI